MFDCRQKDCPNHPEYVSEPANLENETNFKHKFREAALKNHYSNQTLSWENLSEAAGWIKLDGIRISTECLICVHCPKIDVREIKIAALAKDYLRK
jgi:hypothetical protein